MVLLSEVVSNVWATPIALAVLLLAGLLPFPVVLAAYLVVGQGHLLATFLHHVRTKKVRSGYLVTAGVVALVAILYFMVSGAFVPLLLCTALVFGAHMALGEFKLRKELITKAHLLTTVGFLCVLFYVIAGTVMSHQELLLSLILCVGVLAALMRVFFFKNRATSAEQYLWIVQLVVLFVGGIMHAPGNVFGALIVLHVLNWTLYGGALAKRRGYARMYWIETVLIMGGTYALFTLSQMFPGSLLQYVFLPAYYYAWSFGHIALTSALPRARRS